MRRLSLALLVLAAMVLTLGLLGEGRSPAPAGAFHIAYAPGDVFAGVGGGQINHYAPDGTLLEVLDTTSGSSEETGMCFDAAGNLYSTNWTAGNVSKFDNQGGLLVHPWGGPFSTHPETCVVDAAGDIYVGEVDGANLIRKFDAAGNPLATFSPASEARGTDWMDLAADQCTMFYTSEGSSVKRFDVCTNTQLADFATGLAAPCYALRIRANAEVLVTCSTQTYRLNPDGSVNMTYPIAGEGLFAMNLDPDGLHFWTGGYSTGNIYKVDIATGAGTAAPVFTAPPVVFSMAGLAIFGEPTVGGGPKEVDVDIKPGSDPNSIKLSNKGVIPVAILTTASFDATTVDPSTVCFGDAEDATQRDCTEAHAMGHIADADGDGDLDLVLHYETGATGIDPGDTEACLTGETFGGDAIQGCDAVRTLP
ncbi:MAG: hypothetical protein Q8P22_02635 [Chloroflexota bacterium]|nr:hypothetical protein [Chloroflexota bacterium]